METLFLVNGIYLLINFETLLFLNYLCIDLGLAHLSPSHLNPWASYLQEASVLEEVRPLWEGDGPAGIYHTINEAQRRHILQLWRVGNILYKAPVL